MKADLGLHFILSLSGSELSNADQELLAAIRPAGIFLDGKSFEHNSNYETWIKKLDKLISDTKQIINREKIIIAVDHEGGRVHRVPAPLTALPYARDYANYAEEAGEITAIEINSIGANLIFGPVLDIDSNPANPVIAKRAFGTDPNSVIIAAQKYIKSLKKHNLLFAVKHFPGHGDTHQDSHLELPSLDHSLSELKARELLPFQSLISEDLPAVMTAHVKFSAIDRLPATLSKKTIDLLRHDLKFKGVVISDDLDMLAIKNNYQDEQVAKMAFLAGCDMFLFNHHPSRALGFKSQLAQLDQDLLIQSEIRILELLKKANNNKPVVLNQEILSHHQSIVENARSNS